MYVNTTGLSEKLPIDKSFSLIRGCPGWGANLGPHDFIYFLIFTTEPQRLPLSDAWVMLAKLKTVKVLS
jgi:hypothetical protein